MRKIYNVDNAVILAAGRGSRLNVLTQVTPKPLLMNKKDVPIIEDIILKLKEKKINEIYVIVGYKWEMFNYLIDKHNIVIIINKNWQNTNNSSSINAAIHKMRNTLIINGDSIMNKNIIETAFHSSLTYCEKNENLNEWIVKINKDGNVIDFDKNGMDKKGIYQREITFVTKQLVNKIKDNLTTFDKSEYFEYLLIQTALKNKIDFKVHNIGKNLIDDIDDINQFKKYMSLKYLKLL